MTSDPPANVANGSSANVPSDLTQSLLQVFINNLAVQFTERLEAQRASEKKAAEDAAAADAMPAQKEPVSDAAKSEEKRAKISPEDMDTSLCKIDSIIRDNGDREFVPWSDARGKTDDDEGSTDEYDKWVLVLRRVFNCNGSIRKTKLDVKSLFIKDVLREVCEEGAMETESASVYWPYDHAFRFREHIREAAEKKGEVAKKHVGVLLALVEDEYSSKIRDINEMFPRGVSSYHVLREIFWPGNVLIAPAARHLRAYRLVSAKYKVTQCGNYLQLKVEYVNHNGKEFGTQVTEFTIPEYEGVKYIEQLPIFPLKYSSDKQAITSKLKARGQHFASLTGQCYRDFVGIGRTFGWPPRKTSINSRIMVDTATFNRVQADNEISITTDAVSKEIEANNGELTEELLWICTHEIPAFSFMDKGFYTVDVDNISEIVWKDNVFDKLVLPDSHKELVRVLVENHNSKHHFDDFVEGKGKGLVAVLHGPPGVGKTMTAEAVADHTHRPLYMVTSGELGSDPTGMDEELTRVLDLAHTWDCVLLLDEADVFLEQRTTHDLIRNSLVSIFLRQLEYYQGILFLTTNRVGTFDEAFHSRIHVSLHYHDLTLEARTSIWKNFARMMQGNVALTEYDYAALSQTKLNGRQIKNIMKTAQALAQDKNESIAMSHMSQVMEVMTRFDEAFQKKTGTDVEK